MSDHYQTFANSAIGKTVTKNLGLPAPVSLDRYTTSELFIEGAVLLGAATGSKAIDSISSILAKTNSDCFADENNTEIVQSAEKNNLDLGWHAATNKSATFKVAIFDATGIANSEQLSELYDFYHPIARQIEKSGRVIIVARTPEKADTVQASIAQRAIVGFIKSAGKEFKKGITAQVIYVDKGAEKNIESTLRFFASAKSAYVSGQVVRVSRSKTAAVEVDWNKPLTGKVALVTGASRGIGEAIAQTLARDGAHVICLDIPPQQADLDRVAADISGSTLALDITAENAGEAIQQAAKAHGGLDIIVHNAGITRDKTLANMKPEVWDLVININLSAAERVNQYLIDNDGLNENGRIICVSSISGIAGNLGQTNYATSKAGVIGLVQFTAPSLTKGITINAVAPGFIETQMTAAIPFAIREAGRRMNSMSQGGLPIDVAETIAWFASPASTGVNANIVRVCGQSLLGA